MIEPHSDIINKITDRLRENRQNIIKVKEKLKTHQSLSSSPIHAYGKLNATIYTALVEIYKNISVYLDDAQKNNIKKTLTETRVTNPDKEQLIEFLDKYIKLYAKLSTYFLKKKSLLKMLDPELDRLTSQIIIRLQRINKGNQVKNKIIRYFIFFIQKQKSRELEHHLRTYVDVLTNNPKDKRYPKDLDERLEDITAQLMRFLDSMVDANLGQIDNQKLRILLQNVKQAQKENSLDILNHFIYTLNQVHNFLNTQELLTTDHIKISSIDSVTWGNTIITIKGDGLDDRRITSYKILYQSKQINPESVNASQKKATLSITKEIAVLLKANNDVTVTALDKDGNVLASEHTTVHENKHNSKIMQLLSNLNAQNFFNNLQNIQDIFIKNQKIINVYIIKPNFIVRNRQILQTLSEKQALSEEEKQAIVHAIAALQTMEAQSYDTFFETYKQYMQIIYTLKKYGDLSKEKDKHSKEVAKELQQLDLLLQRYLRVISRVNKEAESSLSFFTVLYGKKLHQLKRSYYFIQKMIVILNKLQTKEEFKESNQKIERLLQRINEVKEIYVTANKYAQYEKEVKQILKNMGFAKKMPTVKEVEAWQARISTDKDRKTMASFNNLVSNIRKDFNDYALKIQNLRKAVVAFINEENERLKSR